MKQLSTTDIQYVSGAAVLSDLENKQLSTLISDGVYAVGEAVLMGALARAGISAPAGFAIKYVALPTAKLLTRYVGFETANWYLADVPTNSSSA